MMTLNKNYILPPVLLLLVLAAFTSTVAGQEHQSEHNQVLNQELSQKLLPDPDQKFDPQTAQGVKPEQGSGLQSQELDPGWFFDSFFLGVEFLNNLSYLNMSRVDEGRDGDIWAIGYGKTHSDSMVGLLFRNRNGNWETIDVFDLVYQDESKIRPLPLYVTDSGNVYYSDGYNVILNSWSFTENTIWTPENSGMPEPENEGHEWLTDIVLHENGRPYLLYSYPRVVRASSGTSDWEVYDHTNSPMPDPADGIGIGTELPARHLAFTGDDLWISIHHENGGLIRKSGDDWERYTTENSSLPSNLVSSVLAQSDDQLWVSTLPTEFAPLNGGLVHLDTENDIWTVHTSANGLPNHFVRAYAFEGDRYLWATFGGSPEEGDLTHYGFLAEFDGTSWTTVASKDEFYSSLAWMTVDSRQNKWLAADFNVINGGVASLNQSYISFTNVPQEHSIYSTGAVIDLRWETGSRIERVSFRYSTDGGDTWSVFANNVDAAEFSYPFTVPAYHKTELMLKVSDDANEDIHDVTGPFTVINPDEPYYHLRSLLSDGRYELYDPHIHGWQMKNRESVMWPGEKWSEIEYEGPLARRPFYGVPWNFPSFSSFTRAFGEDETIEAYTPFFGNIIPTLKAGVFWPIMTGQGFNGVCHGFSVTSLIAFRDGNSSLSQLGARIHDDHLYDVEINNDVREMINMIWARQWSRDHFIKIFLASLNDNLLTNLWNTIISGESVRLSDILETDLIFRPPSQTLEDVKEMLDMRADEGYHNPLTLFPAGNIMGGHSVLAYKAEQSSDNPDVWHIYIHDSNHPGANNTFVVVDTEADYYEYQEPGLSNPRFFGNTGLFLGDPVDGYKTTSRLLKEATQENGDDIRDQIANLDEIGYMFTLFGGDADVRITDELGNASSLLRKAGGEKIGLTSRDIPGSFPIVPLVGGFQDPVGYFLADLDYDVELEYPEGGEGNFAVFTGNTVYGFKNHESQQGSIDQLRYGNSFSVFGNGNDHQFDMEVLYLNDLDENMFRLRDMSIANGDSVRFNLENRYDLAIQNYGAPVSLDLELRTDFGDEGYFLYQDLNLDGAAGYKLSVPDWEDIGSREITLLIDTNLDGEYDDSQSLSSMPLPTSTDENEQPATPEGFKLYQNYPNPFNPSTSIRFAIPESGHVQLVIYDLLGREIARLADGYKAAGEYEIIFEAGHLSSGVYLYQLKTDDFEDTRSLMLVK